MRSKNIFGLTLLLAGLALCGVGLWLLLSPAQYVATTRIKFENDMPDSAGEISYDPYFIQTDFEIIQSQLVLSNVVVSLNLNQVWGEKYSNGSPLTVNESIEVIKKHMRLAPARRTKLITITFYSDDPMEASDIANAIAKSYRDYRIQSQKEIATKGLYILTEQYEIEKAKIHEVQTNLDLLRQKLGIQSQSDTPSNHPPEQQPYWNEKQKLEQMLEYHKLLGKKLSLRRWIWKSLKTPWFKPLTEPRHHNFPSAPIVFSELHSVLLACSR